MARQTKTKRGKGANGVGDSLVVNFDITDPVERRALEAAQLLAAKHGRRKQAILALLEAIYTCYEQTGELMTPNQIATALTGNHSATRPAMGFTHAVGQHIAPPMQPNSSTASAANQPLIEVTLTPNKANAHEVGLNLVASMAGFFD